MHNECLPTATGLRCRIGLFHTALDTIHTPFTSLVYNAALFQDGCARRQDQGIERESWAWLFGELV